MGENVIREMLTNGTIQKLSVKDIYFISLSDSGAMGDGGKVVIISLKGQKIIVQSGNYVYGDLDVNKLYKILPFLTKLNSDEYNNIENWHFEYMGAGNNLLIRNDIYNDFMSTIEFMKLAMGTHLSELPHERIGRTLKSIFRPLTTRMEKMNAKMADLYDNYELYAVETLQKIKKG